MSDLDLCDRVKAARRSAGVTQQMLADWVGIHRNTLSRYESYKATPPNWVIVKIGIALSIRSDYFTKRQLALDITNTRICRGIRWAS